MDDRFLARGKRKDNGKWIEGDLIRSKGLYYIHPLSNGVTVKDTLGRLIVMHEIDPSTIGWGTGLTDKNGKRIFTGDILSAKWCFAKLFVVYFGEYKNNNMSNDYKCGHMGFYAHHPDDTIRKDLCYFNSNSEIIGNVYDNPELFLNNEEAHP